MFVMRITFSGSKLLIEDGIADFPPDA